MPLLIVYLFQIGHHLRQVVDHRLHCLDLIHHPTRTFPVLSSLTPSLGDCLQSPRVFNKFPPPFSFSIFPSSRAFGARVGASGHSSRHPHGSFDSVAKGRWRSSRNCGGGHRSQIGCAHDNSRQRLRFMPCQRRQGANAFRMFCKHSRS